MSTIKKINKLELARSLLLKNLLEFEEMIPGSYQSLLHKCGKQNCWCNQQDEGGHPFRRITWTAKGISKAKTIPKADADWIKKVTDTYRVFRKLRKKLKNSETLLKLALDEHEKDRIKQTRKLRNYL